jgi:hypothetical protein
VREAARVLQNEEREHDEHDPRVDEQGREPADDWFVDPDPPRYTDGPSFVRQTPPCTTVQPLRVRIS